MADAIEFYFDFISPYAYLAWQRIHAFAEDHERRVELRPILFAGLLDHWGQLGPAEIPPKRAFVFKQVLRRAHALGVPLTPPPAHPFNPLLGLRLASLELEGDGQRRLVNLLFDAVWAGGPGIEDRATLAGLLDAAGFEGEALLDRATAPANKLGVVDRGREAIERGVFGVPTMRVGDEVFWGDDSLAELSAFLRGDDPVDAAALARWSALPASARRSVAPIESAAPVQPRKKT